MKSMRGLYINLYSKRIAMFWVFALIISSFSCRKQEIQQPEAARNSGLLSSTSSPNLIFEETFESGSPFTTYANLQVATTYGFTVSSDHVFEGSKAGRFELRDTDPEVSSGTRCEAKFPWQDNMDRWYSYSVYFPSADYQYDSKAEIISQWHQGGGVSPSISLITRYDKLVIEDRTVPTSKTQYGLGDVVKDKWQTFVLHIIHSHDADGLIEIWKDGVKIFTLKGANSYDMTTYEKPKWKLGIYKWEWNGTKTTDTHKRVIYFDNVRLGNENASYTDMVTDGGTSITPTPVDTTTSLTTTPATTSTAALVTSFSLINAATEKAVITITDGATISLSKYGLSKINIKANTNTDPGSVKFALSGQQSKNYTDNAAPYALMGDSGSGNYYFGTWDPPATGSYTLKATPYTADGATGTASTATTIHFTIAK